MRRLLLLAALAPAVASAQADGGARGFAGLGGEAEGFARVTPGRAVTLPADHAAHPAFRIEWWYVTANLTGEDGRDYGVQWTLFRIGTDPGGEGEAWSTPQLWMGHAAATSAEAHHAAERFARGGVGQASVEAERGFEAWIDEWRLASLAEAGADPLSRAELAAGGEDFGYALTLEAAGPYVRHGENGYSRKSERGQASYYYSQPFYRASGELTLEGATVAVEGVAWMDREWSSQPMEPDQTGWDWFALHLDTGEKVMLARMRQGESPDALAGTWAAPDGRTEAIAAEAIAMEPVGFAAIGDEEVPVRWRLSVEDRDFSVEARPLTPRAWNDLTTSYWEGPVFIEGTHSGRGYLETTGY